MNWEFRNILSTRPATSIINVERIFIHLFLLGLNYSCIKLRNAEFPTHQGWAQTWLRCWAAEYFLMSFCLGWKTDYWELRGLFLCENDLQWDTNCIKIPIYPQLLAYSQTDPFLGSLAFWQSQSSLNSVCF